MSDTSKASKGKSFWGMVIKPEEKYKFTVRRPLHISKAAIDCAWQHVDAHGRVSTKPVQMSLLVDYGDEKGITLCDLYEHHDSSKREADLDLYFAAGETITLYSAKINRASTLRTTATIHLSGYQK